MLLAKAVRRGIFKQAGFFFAQPCNCVCVVYSIHRSPWAAEWEWIRRAQQHGGGSCGMGCRPGRKWATSGPSLRLAPLLHPYLGDYERTFSSIRQATFLSGVSKVHREGPSNSGARKSRNLGPTIQLRPEYEFILVSRGTQIQLVPTYALLRRNPCVVDECTN